MKKFVIVYRNDSRVIGFFTSEDEADAWAVNVPNTLFKTYDEWEMANDNSDFFVTEFEEV